MASKYCTKCKELKPFSQYYKELANNNGIQRECKICNRKRVDAYRRTRNGLATKIYTCMKLSSIRRNHSSPKFTKNQLKEWLFSQPNFDSLFNAWVKSDYDRMLSPSCDRTDDYKGYDLSRIKLVSWRQNMDKGHADRINGINNKHSKAVIQMTLDGEFIAEYYSQQQASRVTNTRQSTISLCCIGSRNKSGGFKWRYV